MDMTDSVWNSLRQYFEGLSKTGYKSYNEVIRLLVYSFVEYLLYGPPHVYITEEDYRYIMNSLRCLYGDCLIPYPEYKTSVIMKRPLVKYRESELGVYRVSEEDSLRTEI